MLPLFKVHMPESVMEPVMKTLRSGYIGQGAKVEEFEQAIGKKVGSPNALTVNTCTSALRLAMRLAGVGPGTEVITSPVTCVASNSPIIEQHADIVWGDVDPWTGNIDPLDVERKITPKTKAVVAVHWGGYPCDVDDLLRICRKYGIALIEDAAHALGSTYRGRSMGSSQSFCCFSFQAIKHITTVEGGLLVCPSMDSYREGRLLRWYGIDRDTPRKDLRCEEDIKSVGYKYNFNDVGATIGLEQLKYVDGIIEKHRANAAYYDTIIPGFRKVKGLRYAKDRQSSYWLYTIRVSDREDFQDFMKKKDIQVSQVHVRNDVHTAFKQYRRNLPGVDEFTRDQVSIPVGWWVTEEDRRNVAACMTEWDSK